MTMFMSHKKFIKHSQYQYTQAKKKTKLDFLFYFMFKAKVCSLKSNVNAKVTLKLLSIYYIKRKILLRRRTESFTYSTSACPMK